jgi:hypothetical protein
MKPPLYNARFNNATRDVKVSASSRGHQSSHKLNTKYSPPKISSLQHNDIIRLRGGATADMDIADDAESCPPPPPTTHFSYKGDSPWAAPPVAEADATVFHVESTSNAPPKIQHFIGTINLGFAIAESKRNETNIDLLLKRFMAFAKQTDPDLCI